MGRGRGLNWDRHHRLRHQVEVIDRERRQESGPAFPPRSLPEVRTIEDEIANAPESRRLDEAVMARVRAMAEKLAARRRENHG